MRKITLLLFAVLWVNLTTQAVTGWSNDFLTVKAGAVVTATTNNYFIGNTPSSGSAVAFDGIDFGLIDSLRIMGTVMTYQNLNSNTIKGGSFCYKVMSADNSVEVVPATEMSWYQGSVGVGPYTGTTYGTPNFANLLPGGSYKLHVWAKYYRATYVGGAEPDSILNNNGANFVASFQVPNKATDVVLIKGANGIPDNTGYHNLAAALNAINCNSDQSGKNIEVQIAKNSVEYWTATLKQPALGAWNSLVIYPTAPNVSISGLFNSSLIELNGADRVTINGKLNQTGAAKSLTLSQGWVRSSSSASAIHLFNDASYNSITNCIIKSSVTSTSIGGIWIGNNDLVAGTGNDYNTISNNDFNDATPGFGPTYAILATNQTGINNNNIIVDNNRFFNLYVGATLYGVYIKNGTAHTITNNHFYEPNEVIPPTDNGAMNVYYDGSYFPINLSQSTYADSCTIANNYIGGNSPFAQGIFKKSSARVNGFNGILISASTTLTRPSNVQGNVIKNIEWKNPAIRKTMYGIQVFGGNVVNVGTTTPNTISDIVVEHGAINGSIFYAISSENGQGTNKVYNNIINNISMNNVDVAGTTTASTFGSLLYGINRGSFAGASDIYNNTITNLRVLGTSTANVQTVAGIYFSGSAATGFTISGNTIQNLSNNSNCTTATNGNVYGIFWNGTGNTSGNIFSNYVSGLAPASVTSPARVFGINLEATSTTTASACYNNVVSVGNNIPGAVYGIAQNTGMTKVLYNTVAIGGTISSGAFESAAMVGGAATTTGRQYQNNIFYNGRSNDALGTATSKHLAVKLINKTGLTINANDYYVNGTGGVLGNVNNGADITNLTDWQTASAGDGLSLVTNPIFVGTGLDALYYQSMAALTPTASSLTDAGGTAITKDYSNTDRSLSDQMGAFIRTQPNYISQDNNHTSAIYASNKSIVVKNAEEIVSVVVYDAIGNTVKRIAVNATSVIVPMTEKGVFIVNVTGKAGKVYTQRVIMK